MFELFAVFFQFFEFLAEIKKLKIFFKQIPIQFFSGSKDMRERNKTARTRVDRTVYFPPKEVHKVTFFGRAIISSSRINGIDV